MSRGKISEKVVTGRLAWIEDVSRLAYRLREWVASHPELVDRAL
jgi:hypothetical protein